MLLSLSASRGRFFEENTEKRQGREGKCRTYFNTDPCRTKREAPNKPQTVI
jgi:hypothetical protein